MNGQIILADKNIIKTLDAALNNTAEFELDIESSSSWPNPMNITNNNLYALSYDGTLVRYRSDLTPIWRRNIIPDIFDWVAIDVEHLSESRIAIEQDVLLLFLQGLQRVFLTDHLLPNIIRRVTTAIQLALHWLISHLKKDLIVCHLSKKQ